MERINWIDWAKALGIYLVVLGHSAFMSKDVHGMIFMIHMPLFFVISGYLFKIKGKNIKDITYSNVKGLLIPYLLYNVIFILGTLMTRGFLLVVGKSVDWNFSFFYPFYHFIFGITNGIFDGPTWFLLALIWCKYLSFIIHTFSLKYRLLTLIVCVLLFYVRVVTNVQYLFALDAGLAGLFWFEIGYLIKNKLSEIKVPIIANVMIIIVGSFICYWGYTNNGTCNYMLADVGGVIGLISTTAGLLAFFSLCRLLNSIHIKLISDISKASIVIMCLHMFFQGYLEKVIKMFFCEDLLSMMSVIVTFILVFVLTLLCPFIQKHVPSLVGGRK